MPRMIEDGFYETRVRIEKQAKVGEIAALTLNPRSSTLRIYQDVFIPKNWKKSIERWKKSQTMNLRNSSQNRKAVKMERYNLSDTK